MTLKNFKEEKKKRTIIFGTMVVTILLLAGILLYRTYALYETNNSFDVIKGRVPDQNYDAMLTFTIEDENGNKTYRETMPEGRDWDVTVTCNNGATGIWDMTNWGIQITNFTETRTKCTANFGPQKPLGQFGIKDDIVTEGNGLYEVPHEDAEITYTNDTTAINNLKMTEYRYAGSDPNNYVIFNNELWRIIGLVNTPEGQRVKLIRNESIGKYSWDNSESSVNWGEGVNEWSQADLMKVLNSGYENESVGGSLYWNRGSGSCYNGSNNAITSCNFSNTGLTNEAKSMIDTITWNTGTKKGNSIVGILVSQFYNYERSNNTGKICNSSVSYCTDTVERRTTWTGEVGLMYPSDYGYATSGGSIADRASCLAKTLDSWSYSFSDCKDNDWLYTGLYQWTLTPYATAPPTNQANRVAVINSTGTVSNGTACGSGTARPTIYLNSNVRVTYGEGTELKPYQLSA